MGNDLKFPVLRVSSSISDKNSELNLMYFFYCYY